MEKLLKKGIVTLENGIECIIKCWKSDTISRLEWIYATFGRRGGIYMSHITQVVRQGDRGVTIHYGTSCITLLMEDSGEATAWYDLIFRVWKETISNPDLRNHNNLDWARDNHLFVETNEDVTYEGHLETKANASGCLYDAKITELVVGKKGLAWRNKITTELVTFTPYSNMRRQGVQGKQFLKVEVGRRSATGSGVFTFIVEDAHKILRSVLDKLAEQKKLTAQAQLKSVNDIQRRDPPTRIEKEKSTAKGGEVGEEENKRGERLGYEDNLYSYATIPVLQWPRGKVTEGMPFGQPIAPSEDRDGYLIARKQKVPQGAEVVATGDDTMVTGNEGYLVMSSKASDDGYCLMASEGVPKNLSLK